VPTRGIGSILIWGFAKAAGVLRTGGTIALFQTSFVVDEPVIAAFDTVYPMQAPEVTPGLATDRG